MFSIITKVPYSAYQSCLKKILSCTRASQNSSLEASLVYIRSTNVNKISQYYLRWNKNHKYLILSHCYGPSVAVVGSYGENGPSTFLTVRKRSVHLIITTEHSVPLRTVRMLESYGACILISQQNMYTVWHFVRYDACNWDMFVIIPFQNKTRLIKL